VDPHESQPSPREEALKRHYQNYNPFQGGAPAPANPGPRPATRREPQGPRHHDPVDVPSETRRRGIPREFADDLEPLPSPTPSPPPSPVPPPPTMPEAPMPPPATSPRFEPSASYTPVAPSPAAEVQIVRLNDRPGISAPPPSLPFNMEEEPPEDDEYEDEEEYDEDEEYEDDEYEDDEEEEEDGSDESDEYEYEDEDDGALYRSWDPEELEDEGPEARASDFRDFSQRAPGPSTDTLLAEAGPRRLEIPGRRTPVLPTPERLETGPVPDERTTTPGSSAPFATGLSAAPASPQPSGPPPGQGLWEKSSLLAEALNRLPLTRNEVTSLYDAVQRDPRAYMALARLCGITRIYLETSERTEGAADTLATDIGSMRQLLQEKVGSEPGVSSHSDPRMLGDLLQAVTELRVLREGFDLVPASGNTPIGNPRMIGLVSSVSLVAWQARADSTNGGVGRDPYAPDGSAQDLLGRLLGRYSKQQSGRKPKPIPGEYLLGSVDIQVGGRVEQIWFLSQVTKSMNLKVPSRRQDGEYRMVQGLVDGLVAIDPDSGRITTIMDDSGYGPLVLSRRMQKTGGAQQPAVTLHDSELSLDKEGTFFLEPAYLAQRCGLLDADSASRKADPLLPTLALRGHTPEIPEPGGDMMMPGVPKGPLASRNTTAGTGNPGSVTTGDVMRDVRISGPGTDR